jgi:hypothetical protein
MKQSTIQIHDARRKGGKGYRVKSVAKNGEILQVSQVLDTVANVKKHVNAMYECWKTGAFTPPIIRLDFTTSQVFTKKGWAKEGKKSKSIKNK